MSSEAAPGGERLRLALWTHQLVEYLLGVLIVMQSINAGPAAPSIAAAGGLLVLVAAFTDAPLAVARWIPTGLHRVLDVAVIAVLLLTPFVSGTTAVLAWCLCLLAAAALVWLHWHTRWTRPARRGTAASGTATTAASPPSAPGPSPSPSLAESARSLGATVDRTTRGASRAAGRIYGRSRARRAGSGEQSGPDA